MTFYIKCTIKTDRGLTSEVSLSNPSDFYSLLEPSVINPVIA